MDRRSKRWLSAQKRMLVSVNSYFETHGEAITIEINDHSRHLNYYGVDRLGLATGDVVTAFRFNGNVYIRTDGPVDGDDPVWTWMTPKCFRLLAPLELLARESE